MLTVWSSVSGLTRPAVGVWARLLAASWFLAAVFCPVRAVPVLDPGLPDYAPVAENLTGILHVVGSDTMDVVVFGWIQLFRKYHPGVHVTMEARSSLAACPALLSGAAHIGPMTRRPPAEDIAAFEAKFGYKPLILRVGGGSYAVEDHAHAIAVYVNSANPLQRLTLAQLDAIYSSLRKRGASAQIATWGQLGLTGEWADRPVVPYAARRPNGIVTAFQERVLLMGDFRATIRERTNAPQTRVLTAVVAAVAEDSNGIGYAGFAQGNSAVKSLPIAVTETGPYVAGTLETVIDQSYPLTRSIYIAINKAPGQALAPNVREFLRLVLSRPGQQIVEAEGNFLPLPAAIVSRELNKLEADTNEPATSPNATTGPDA